MATRDQQIYDEAAALWREIFGEPPPPSVDGSAMLEMITRNLGDLSYERLRSPYLRPSTISGPGQPKGPSVTPH
ncbi:MAG TPA: hypothetical protein VFW13_14525 [Phenylobacterium sp.]|nr:hypothetical protein [Phenylobacterium sp.]